MNSFFPVIGLAFCSLIFSSCETAPKKSTTRTPATNQRVALPNNPVSAMAEREIVRRQARIQAADQSAHHAMQQSAAGNDAAAIEEYSRALDTLPAKR